MTGRCLMCAARAVHDHHAIYRQEIARRKGDQKDPRNLVPMCFDCHGAHHGRSRVIFLHNLPDSVYEFATELMGLAAFDYLARRYSGGDPRLIAILDAA